MRKVLAIVLAVALSLAIAVPALAAELPTRDLIIDGGPGGGARTDVGGITVDLTDGEVTVTYDIDDPNWEILETHVYVSNALPKKHSPGKFNTSDGEGVAVSTGRVIVYIAAHAELGMIDPGTGDPIYYPDTTIQITETAWAQNQDFLTDGDLLFRGNSGSGRGSSWATFFTIIA